MLQNLQNFVKFQNFQLDNLVDFEKCCKTHIYLQKSVPIQLKTSNILLKFAKNWQLPYGSAHRLARVLCLFFSRSKAWYLGAGAQLKQQVDGPLCGTVRELLYTCEQTNERKGQKTL